MTVVKGPGGPPVTSPSGLDCAANGNRSRRASRASLSIDLLERLAACLRQVSDQVGHRDGPRPSPPPEATTLAVGEESGGGPRPSPPPEASTLAVGEESGGGPAPKPPGEVTTLAVGEESGSGPRPRPPGEVTTLAYGEE